MAYKDMLPQAFPYVVELPTGHVDSELLELFEPREQFNNGSSFAITRDAKPGYVHLWMSESSYITWKECQDTLERRAKEIAEEKAKREAKIEAKWGPMLP